MPFGLEQGAERSGYDGLIMDNDTPTFRRNAFFISGFDPRGVLFLQKNCATETERWSNLTGIPVRMGPRKSVGKIAKSWTFDADMPKGSSHTDFQFLQWDDIIREHWDRRNWMVFLQSLKGTVELTRWGIYGHALRESWPIAVVMTVPSAIVALHLLSGLFLLLGVAAILTQSVWLAALGLALFAIAAAASLYVLSEADQYKPEWNARIGLFARKLALDQVAGLQERLDSFADHIIETIDREKPDEALLIGHSFGTSLATIVASRILAKRPDLAKPGSPFTLVTLGQTQTLLTRMPMADWYRAELERYRNWPDFTWLDFSSPPDGACYALLSPLDYRPDPPANQPKCLNAQFHKIFTPERMAAARADRMILHFFYLMSPDHPQIDGDLYDFVTLIAGPESASQRYRDRAGAAKPFFRKKP